MNSSQEINSLLKNLTISSKHTETLTYLKENYNPDTLLLLCHKLPPTNIKAFQYIISITKTDIFLPKIIFCILERTLDGSINGTINRNIDGSIDGSIVSNNVNKASKVSNKTTGGDYELRILCQQKLITYIQSNNNINDTIITHIVSLLGHEKSFSLVLDLLLNLPFLSFNFIISYLFNTSNNIFIKNMCLLLPSLICHQLVCIKDLEDLKFSENCSLRGCYLECVYEELKIKIGNKKCFNKESEIVDDTDDRIVDDRIDDRIDSKSEVGNKINNNITEDNTINDTITEDITKDNISDNTYHYLQILYESLHDTNFLIRSKVISIFCYIPYSLLCKEYMIRICERIKDRTVVVRKKAILFFINILKNIKNMGGVVEGWLIDFISVSVLPNINYILLCTLKPEIEDILCLLELLSNYTKSVKFTYGVLFRELQNFKENKKIIGALNKLLQEKSNFQIVEFLSGFVGEGGCYWLENVIREIRGVNTRVISYLINECKKILEKNENLNLCFDRSFFELTYLLSVFVYSKPNLLVDCYGILVVKISKVLFSSADVSSLYANLCVYKNILRMFMHLPCINEETLVLVSKNLYKMNFFDYQVVDLTLCVIYKSECPEKYVKKALNWLVKKESDSLKILYIIGSVSIKHSKYIEGVITNDSKIKGMDVNNSTDSKLRGTSNTTGVNNSTVKQEGVSNSTNEQDVVSNSTNEQHPLTNSTNEQHSLTNSTNEQHPLNNNYIEQHPLNNSTILDPNLSILSASFMEENMSFIDPDLTRRRKSIQRKKPTNEIPEYLEDLIFYLKEKEIFFGENVFLNQFIKKILKIIKNHQNLPETPYTTHFINTAHLTLFKCMTVSSELFLSNLPFFINSLSHKNFLVRNNALVAFADYIIIYNSLIENHVYLLYTLLSDTVSVIRKNCLLVINYLVNNEILKIKGYCDIISQCLIDSNLEVQKVAEKVLNEICKKESIYGMIVVECVFKNMDSRIYKFLGKIECKERIREGVLERIKGKGGEGENILVEMWS
ncbi:subunit 1 of chromosome condensation complex [Hamiltosporidium tvaerminnensis]|uniref:Subunit 1 of chromosome condensation complex n=1 Tax=Hamiltosporidium tvaerminnensis TaxID=1176355 RepID=A0A4Q9KXJ9_9MICR|nr:subunit 1 of chromosome condensation complex [Hamiltosporidium tvaerminnensis]